MNLTNIYKLCSLENQIKIDNFFLRAITDYNEEEYVDLLRLMNNKYNSSFVEDEFINYKDFAFKFRQDIDDYLRKIYIQNQGKNYDFIFYNPLTLEILNNNHLYQEYLFPLTSISKNDLCKQMLLRMYSEIDKIDVQNKIKKLLDNYCNYNNFYYTLFTEIYFKIIGDNDKCHDLLLSELDRIINYFVKKEAIQKNLKIELKIVRLSELLKELVKIDFYKYRRKNKSSYKILLPRLTQLWFNNKKIVLNKLSRYIISDGCHIKSSATDYSTIEINVSHLNKRNIPNIFILKSLLNTIFHELRHAYQYSETNDFNAIVRERTEVISRKDNNFHRENYSFIELEVDANLYGLEKCQEIVNEEENTYKRKRAFSLISKYENKLKIDKKIDALILEDPSLIRNNKWLQLEYEQNGHPKSFTAILNNKDKITSDAYNDMIIRCLNRLSKVDYVDMLVNLYRNNHTSLNDINQAIMFKMSELNQVESFVETYSPDQEYKIREYIDLITFYYLEFLEVKNRNILAKKISK